MLLSALLAGCGARPAAPAWHLDASIIEACSCPHVCQCFFGNRPAQHEGGQCYCRFNSAFKVQEGRVGGTVLDGALFWVSGDLGDGRGLERDWAVVTFDPRTAQAQRTAILFLLERLYPSPWKSFRTAEGVITWRGEETRAYASIDEGLTALVELDTHSQAYVENPGTPAVVRGVRYMRSQGNDGFVLMPCVRSRYRGGPNAFAYEHSNGFRITIHMNSDLPVPESGNGM